MPKFNDEKKEFGGWWLFVLGLIVVTVVVLGFMSYLGKLSGTFIERKVLESSYQKQHADETAGKTYKAQLAVIDQRLLTETNPAIINDLKDQRAFLLVMISAK